MMSDLDIDAIRARGKITRDGFYHVVGVHYVLREADFDALVAEVKRLRERISDFEDDFRKVTSETCAPDERHCSCVPHLRADVKRERAAVVAFMRATPEVEFDELPERIERGEHRREGEP